MTELTIDNMTIRFDTVVAVDNLNLEVEQGEFLALLGPSGCGKTTTLRSIAGFLKPDAGRILFDGEVVNNVPPQKRNTAMVFQSYALFPHMTVRENIRFGLRMQKISRSEQDGRIEEAIEMLGLGGLGGRKPSQLSGGQQQRVALARAVVTRPRILLFDEPLSNLDAKLRERVRVEIRTLQRHLGITSVFVTHDQAEALNISDRIVVMNEGRVEQVGDPFTIYRHPANSFVAEFIGVANIVEGRVVARETGRLSLETAVGRLCLATDRADQEDRVLFSWRPEDMVVFREGMANRLEGTISHAIFMGNFTDLLVDVRGMPIRVQVGNDQRYREGEPIALSVPETKFQILR